jgi:hypothetical protein
VCKSVQNTEVSQIIPLEGEVPINSIINTSKSNRTSIAIVETCTVVFLNPKCTHACVDRLESRGHSFGSLC